MVFVIWVTGSCNMKCTYCYEGVEKNKDFMSKETAGDVVDWILKLLSERNVDCAQIRFHGGEPLLNFEAIRKIVDGLKKNAEVEYSFQLTTNALCMSEEQMMFLGRTFDELAVSIDGVEEVHNSNRIVADGSPSFNRVFNNACKLKKIAPQTMIRMTITPVNCNRFADNVKFLISHGFNDIISSIDLFDEEWTDELINILEEQCHILEVYITENYDKESISIGYPIYYDIKCRKCTGGMDGFNINYNGDLYPCTYTVGKQQFKCGNIVDGPDMDQIDNFKKIYNHPIEACDGCEAYNVCMAVRCKYLNYSLSGNMFIPSAVLCSICRRSVQRYMDIHN